MNQESVVISVIMSVYNAEAFIRESIDSILNQTFPAFEVIIIDDCSTDNTYEIIKSYQDKRIKLIRNDVNEGLTVNLNKAINLSSGKYLVRMDADDISLPDRFKVQYQFMEVHPKVGLCGSWYEVFGNDKVEAKYKTTHIEIALQFLYECHVCHPTIIIRKETLVKNNIFYNPLYVVAQDYDLMSRIARVSELANIPQILLKYRWHGESVSTTKKELQYKNKNKVIYNQFSDLGIKLRTEEIDLFVMFCNSKFDFDYQAICKIENLLVRIINANEQSQYLDVLSLQSFLGEKWFHACYNSTHVGIKIYRKYLDSVLYIYQNIDWFTQVKFFFKSLFRK